MDYAAVYGKLHENAKAYPGNTIRPYVPLIHRLISDLRGTRLPDFQPRLLDYGCGKGYQYLGNMRIHEEWGGYLPWCYDVGVRQLAFRPPGKFDGVISTDMLEHIMREDLDFVLGDIFGYLNETGPAFAFFSIACRPAKKTFEDGSNVHVTIEPPKWWIEKIEKFRRDRLIIMLAFDVANLPRDIRILGAMT